MLKIKNPCLEINPYDPSFFFKFNVFYSLAFCDTSRMWMGTRIKKSEADNLIYLMILYIQ